MVKYYQVSNRQVATTRGAAAILENTWQAQISTKILNLFQHIHELTLQDYYIFLAMRKKLLFVSDKVYRC